MNKIPELAPISSLRHQQNQILDKISDQPVILTQYGRAKAVLVHPEQWNQLIEELVDLQDALDAIEADAKEEPATPFEDYLVERGELVPVSDQ